MSITNVPSQSQNDARYVPLSTKGLSNGVAPLDSTAKLPLNIQQTVAPLNAMYGYAAYESGSLPGNTDINIPLNQYIIQSSDISKIEVANDAIILKAPGIYMVHSFWVFFGGTAGQQIDANLYYDESTPDADTNFSFSQRNRLNDLRYTQTFLVAVGIFGESNTKTMRLAMHTPANGYSYAYVDLRIALVVEHGLPLGRAESSLLPGMTYSANHTLTLSDLGAVVEIDTTSDVSVTLPSDSSIPVGAVFEVMRKGTGAVALVADSGVTILTPAGGLKIAVRYASATIRKSDATTYIVDGDLIA